MTFYYQIEFPFLVRLADGWDDLYFWRRAAGVSKGENKVVTYPLARLAGKAVDQLVRKLSPIQ